MIHLKDAVVEGDSVKSMACGLGEINYDTIVKFALEKKPFIHATLEDTKPDNAVAAREFIQNIEKKFS